MSLNTIRAAIEGRIATEFAASPVIPVAYQNVPFTPPNNSSFIQAFVGFGDQAYLTLLAPATGMNRVNGALTVNIFTPRGVGPGANLTIAQRVINLFSRLILQNINFDAANGPNAIATAAPEGFYQTQVTITFEAFEQS